MDYALHALANINFDIPGTIKGDNATDKRPFKPMNYACVLANTYSYFSLVSDQSYSKIIDC